VRLLLGMLTLCLFCINYLAASEVQAAKVMTLEGKGTVVKEKGMERIHVSGTVKGYINGTFVWEETHAGASGAGNASERGEITITGEDGYTLILKFTGKASMQNVSGGATESATGSFSYLDGTGPWRGRLPSGTYTKAGVFKGDSVELSMTLTVESE